MVIFIASVDLQVWASCYRNARFGDKSPRNDEKKALPLPRNDRKGRIADSTCHCEKIRKNFRGNLGVG